jgi:hypothetical protein
MPPREPRTPRCISEWQPSRAGGSCTYIAPLSRASAPRRACLRACAAKQQATMYMVMCVLTQPAHLDAQPRGQPARHWPLRSTNIRTMAGRSSALLKSHISCFCRTLHESKCPGTSIPKVCSSVFRRAGATGYITHGSLHLAMEDEAACVPLLVTKGGGPAKAIQVRSRCRHTAGGCCERRKPYRWHF